MPRRKTSKSPVSEKKVREIDAYVGARVRSRRIQLKISQTDLGKAAGITFQQIQKYEKGVNRIGSSRLQAMATVLGVAPDYFFENQVSKSALEPDGLRMDTFNEFVGSPDGVRLMQAFVKIKNKLLQRTIVKLVADLER
jgi:transcriptional regulator with XRE-family HTH domain